MTQKKKLLSYNTEKHPLVAKFFDEIGSGLQSHYIREAIEFYIKYRDSINNSSSTPTVPIEPVPRVNANTTNENTNENKQPEPSVKKDDDNYTDFNPSDIL